jgi:hypothetical protein
LSQPTLLGHQATQVVSSTLPKIAPDNNALTRNSVPTAPNLEGKDYLPAHIRFRA